MNTAYDAEHEKLICKLLEHAPDGVRREHIERAIPGQAELIGYRRDWEGPAGSAILPGTEQEYAEFMRAKIWERVFVEVEVDRRLGLK